MSMENRKCQFLLVSETELLGRLVELAIEQRDISIHCYTPN